MALIWAQAKARSEMNRLKTYQDMAAFYNNDYEIICEYLKEFTLGNPYSAETIAGFKGQFVHRDQLRKILRKITAGIYTQRPVRKLILNPEAEEPAEDQNFAKFLEEIKYHDAVIKAFDAASYFNTVLVMPVYIPATKKIRLDVITPENFRVETDPADYLRITGLAVRKMYEDEIQSAIWTDAEHFIKDAFGNTKAVNGNEDMKNPFGKIPVAVLRLRDGNDFFGEPNWSLFDFQRRFDVALTDKMLAEQKITHHVWFGINTKLAQGKRLAAGELIQVEHNNPETVVPSLESLTANYDFTSLRENAEWDYKNLAQSQGISASNVSSETEDLSGIAKMVDNQELQESRIEKMNKLYDFEIELMQTVRMVANAYGYNFSEAGEIYLEFVPDPVNETIADKVARREMEKKYFIANEVDFVIQDKELLSREEAINYIKLRQTELENMPEDTEEAPDEREEEKAQDE